MQSDNTNETKGLKEEKVNDLFNKENEYYIKRVYSTKTPILQHIIKTFNKYRPIDHKNTFIKETKNGTITLPSLLNKRELQQLKKLH